jgi:hypothetical protein
MINKTIGSWAAQWEADLVISLLQENGFHPSDLETSPNLIIAGPEHFYRVSVPEDEAEDVRAFLRENGYEKNLT